MNEEVLFLRNFFFLNYRNDLGYLSSRPFRIDEIKKFNQIMPKFYIHVSFAFYLLILRHLILYFINLQNRWDGIDFELYFIIKR